MENIKFNDKGLVTAIAQDYVSGKVLMVAYMNEEAVEKTIQTGTVHYFSRSRNALWQKGETSGHIQHVKDILIDCDGDAILLKVQQIGVACHTGNETCFFTQLNGQTTENSASEGILKELYETIEHRRDNPVEKSYTNYLFDKGIDKMLKKVGEEAAEVIIASKNRDKPEIALEIADLLYHLSVDMVETGVTWDDVWAELLSRRPK